MHQDISMAAGVRAFPTFQFFLNGAKVDELKGANQQKLESMVVSHKAGAKGSAFGGKGFTLSGGESAPAWDGIGNPPGAPVDKEAARKARLQMYEAQQAKTQKFNTPACDNTKSNDSNSATTEPVAKLQKQDTTVEDDDDALLQQALAMSTESGNSTSTKSTSTSTSSTSATAMAMDVDDGDEMVPVPVKEDILKELLGMGFSDVRCRKSIVHGKTLEGALEWLDLHQGDAEIDEAYVVTKRDAEKEIARLNAKPLTAEEKKQKQEELKVKIAKMKEERLKKEKAEMLEKEKSRRSSGQELGQIQDDRDRMQRKRDAERQKKEKDVSDWVDSDWVDSDWVDSVL